MFILHLLLFTTGGAVYEASIGAVSIRTEPWRLHWVLQRSRLSRPCWGRGEERNQYILLLRWNKSQRCIDCAQGKYTLSLLCKRYKSSTPPENTKCAMRQSGGTLYYRPKNMNVSNRSNCCLERRDAPNLRSLAESPFSWPRTTPRCMCRVQRKGRRGWGAVNQYCACLFFQMLHMNLSLSPEFRLSDQLNVIVWMKFFISKYFSHFKNFIGPFTSTWTF